MVKKTKSAIASLILLGMLLLSCSIDIKPSEPPDLNRGLHCDGCSIDSASGSNYETIDSFLPDYDTLVRRGAPFEVCVVWESDITWLSLSLTEYSFERNLVREWMDEEVELIRRTGENPGFEPTIYIQVYDLNHDGNDEVIAFIGGSSFLGGARSSGRFQVFVYESGEIKNHLSLPLGIYIDVSALEYSHQIGILDRVDGMDDFIILNRLFVWNGTSWG